MRASSRLRNGALVAVATGALAAALGTPAAAAPDASEGANSAQAQVQHTALARQVAGSLGNDTGGVFLGENGSPHIAVTNQADAAAARAKGVTPKMVKYSLATLRTTKNAMDNVKNVPQTSWGIDPSTNKVVVTILDSASPATSAKVTKAARGFGDKARIVRKHGRNELYVAGGDSITNGQATCSNGFNVTRGGDTFMLTAGHCTDLGGTWNSEDGAGGEVVESDVPGADSGLIANPQGGPGEVNTGQAITSAGTPAVGESMSKSGQTTGVTEGEVFAVDQSVNFDVGVLEHMTGAKLHSDHGDSGGTGFAGSMGVGTLSGGNSTDTYFYPLERELSMYGLSLA